MKSQDNKIAASYLMELIDEVEQAIWEKYGSYKKATSYVKKYHEEYWNGQFLNGENFSIEYKEDGKLDLVGTLDNIDGDTLITMAIDLGIETPDFIPSFPTFRNVVKENKNLKQIFDTAFETIEKDPALSIANSNSALESLLKTILKESSDEYKEGDTLKKLIEKTLKLFDQYPHSEQYTEIKQLGSALISACAAIENLRSNKTSSHGKTSEDHLIEDPVFAYFVINSVATVGLYVDSFYKKNFKQTDQVVGENEEINPEDIPF